MQSRPKHFVTPEKAKHHAEILAKGVYLYLKKEKTTAKGAPKEKQVILPKNRMKKRLEQHVNKDVIKGLRY